MPSQVFPDVSPDRDPDLNLGAPHNLMDHVWMIVEAARVETMRFRGSLIAGVIISVSTFAVMNYRNVSRSVICDDCFLPYGLPFTFFRGSGFAGGGGVVWIGIVGDLLVVLACGAAIAWLLDRIPKAEDDSG